jgi:hypothetical protein
MPMTPVDQVATWVDGAAGGASFTASLAITYTAPTAPSAPIAVQATGGDGGALIIWSPTDNSGILGVAEGDITNYIVQALNS